MRNQYSCCLRTVLEIRIRNLLFCLACAEVSSFAVFLLDNVDLGTACGKYFRVSCLSIIDPGTSNLCCFSFLPHHLCHRDYTFTSLQFR